MLGWIGVVAASAIGLAGGAIGTNFGVNNTSGPRERMFMIKPAMICWVKLFVVFALPITLPNPHRWLVRIPCLVVLALRSTWRNRKQQSIRSEEAQNTEVRTKRRAVSHSCVVRLHHALRPEK